MSQSNEKALAWLKQFHTAGDSLNAERYIKEFYTEDAVLQFGNHPLIQGQQNLINMFKTQFGLLDMMKHEIGHIDVLPDRIYQYATISYKVKGDTEVIKIPGLAVFHKTPEEQKIRRFDVFIDASPLTEKMKSVGLI
jgi:ketosteroid isomerase-like protein